MDLLSFTSTVFGIFISFCMYTTLYGKGNPLRSWAEFSYIACGTTMSVMMAYTYIKKTAIIPLITHPFTIESLAWVAAIILGLMMWFRVHPTYSYISRVPIAFTVGIGMGYSISTVIFTGFLKQISGTIVKLWTAEGGWPYFITRLTIVVCVITMLSFFLYTTEIKGPHVWSATVGEYAMYIAFGVVFAQTFMGRLGLFVGYMQQCMYPVWKQPYTLGSAILVFLILLILDKTGWAERLSAT